LTKIWNIPPKQVASFEKFGSYYARINSTIFAISVNTLYWADDNLYAKNQGCDKDHHLGSQLFEWLENVLKNVVRAHLSTAFIFGHRYPLDAKQIPSCYIRYVKMVNTYSDVLRGHFFGGSEYIDRFYIIPKLKGSEGYAGVVNIIPAVEPKYNPAVRQYVYNDDANAALKNYIQYYASLRQSNNDRKLNLVEEYQPLSAYQMKDLSAASWVNLNQQLDKDEKIGDLYSIYKFVSSNQVPETTKKRIPYVTIMGSILFVGSWIVMVYKCCRWPNITYAQELQYQKFKNRQDIWGS